MPKVSVIVPVYKVEQYIGKCIESLQNQTMTDIEIILIDDGSPDNSGKICDTYAADDHRIVVIHQDNAGVSVARNAGLDVATGEWITFVDGDDYVAETMCEDIVNAATNNGSDIVIFSFYVLNSNGIIPSRLLKMNEGNVSDEKEYIQKKIITQYYDREIASIKGVSAGTCWGKLVHRNIIDKYHVRFVPGLIRAQDTVFWLNTFEMVKSIYYLDKELYYYRVTDSNITSGNRYIADSEERFGQLINEYQKFIIRNKKDDAFEKALRIRVLQVLYWHLIHNYFHDSNQVNLTERINRLRELCSNEPYSSALHSGDICVLPKSTKLLLTLCKRKLFLLCFYTYKAIEHRRKKQR